MEAPKPIKMETPQIDKDLKDIKFISEFNIKLNNEDYLIMIGILKDYLVIKAINKEFIKCNYISFYTYEQLKDISKSMKYFDDINDFISFLENKGNKNEILLKKENEKIFIEVKVVSPSGKEDIILLEVKPNEISDKELINHLLKKVDDLEKQISFLNKEVYKNKEDIQYLIKEIDQIKKEKENEKIKEFELDSTITNNNEIKFIIDYLKELEEFKNKDFKLNLLFRGTRDGDKTADVHNKCDGLKNIIVFMKNEQGNTYGMYSEIGWETRNNPEYRVDNYAFLFSLNKAKIYKAIKGKAHVCWIKNECGLWLFNTMGFYNNFLNKKRDDNLYDSSALFENSKIEDFNSGQKTFKFLEIEIFQINKK